MRAPAFWTIRHGRDAAPLLRLLLTPLGVLYGWSVARRLARTKPLALGIPVICLGNISVGGTGKTPLAHLVRDLLTHMCDGPVAIVSRGYGGTLQGPLLVDPARHTAGEVGDEPLMLARDGPVIIAKDRALAGPYAQNQGMKAIVLDDGHQNPALEKSLSIVVVDGQTGFGNGHLVPAGPLREPAALGLARADLVIVMGEVSEDAHDDLAIHSGPKLQAYLVPKPTPLTGKVIGFCGIGRPEKFEATLRALGLELIQMIPFPDHYAYQSRDLARLQLLAKDEGAQLVTTHKDYVRLPRDFAAGVQVVEVVAQVDPLAALRAALQAALDSKAQHR